MAAPPAGSPGAAAAERTPEAAGEDAGPAPPAVARPLGRGECGTKNWARSAAGTIDDLSEEQFEVLRAFKASLGDNLEAVRALHETPDYTALRFLRARQFDADNATKMVMACVEWRRSFRDLGSVRQLGTRPVPEILNGVTIDELSAYYENGYTGTFDRLGRPIFIDRAGLVDSESLAAVCGIERMLDYHVHQIEGEQAMLLGRATAAAGRPISEMCTIIDCAGMGMSLINAHTKKYFGLISAVDSDFYPESAGTILCINAPGVFSIAWSFVKKMLDKRTVAKIRILSSSDPWREELLKHIAPENLPVEYGGTFESPDGLFPTSRTQKIQFGSKVPVHTDEREGCTEGERVRYKFHSKGGGMTFTVEFLADGQNEWTAVVPPAKIEKMEVRDEWVTVPSQGRLRATWKPSRASGRVLFVRVESETQRADDIRRAEETAREIARALDGQGAGKPSSDGDGDDSPGAAGSGAVGGAGGATGDAPATGQSGTASTGKVQQAVSPPEPPADAGASSGRPTGDE